MDIPIIAPDAGADEVPPPDISVDQLAAAYERLEAQEDVPMEQAAGHAQAPRPPATGRRPDNLLLYLDTEDAEEGG